MKKRRPTRRIHNIAIPMTPIIDIVFLLLIYFMLASNFIQEQQFSVDLPESSKGVAKAETALVVVVSKAGSLILNGKKTDLEGLKGLLLSRPPKSREEGLEIRAHRQAPIQFIISIMDTARQAGIKKVMITTQRKN
ncbi:MAG: biopolymer transporter ExbD [Thermodesulfobacteria bacterium]|nr:biopolymer transporter ExbD [Thermodesulfobacteriota bacterium]